LDWPAIRRNVESVDAGKVKSALALTLLGFGLQSFIRLGSNILLTWLLFPEVFGLMALVSVAIFGVHQLSDVGGHQIIIQSKREDRAFLDTIWTIQVVRGVLLWIVLAALAYPFALLYEEEMLAWLLPVAGFDAVFCGLESTKEDMMYRRLTVGRVKVMHLTVFITKIVVTLAWACVWQSAWALVIGQLTGGFLQMVLTHALLPGPLNRLHWDRSAVIELRSFGRWIFISTAVGFLAEKVDTLLLGKLLDTKFLGFYSIALGLVAMPLSVMEALTGEVLFPVLGQQERAGSEEFMRTFHAARDLILAVAGVFVLGMVLFPPAFFGFCYRSDYSDAIWITQGLSAYLWIALLGTASDDALLAKGDSRSLMISRLCKLAVTTMGCIAGFYILGLRGFLAGMALGQLASYLTTAHMLNKRHQLPILSHDIGVTLRLFVPLMLGVCAWRFVFPSVGLSDRVSSLITTLIVLPVPSLLAATKLLKAMRSKSEDA